MLAGCTASDGQGPIASSQDLSSQIREVDLSPPPRQRVEAVGPQTPRSDTLGATYNGDGSVARLDNPPAAIRDSEPDRTPTGSLHDGAENDKGNKGYELNFENTPVATVAKAILGDILGVGYTIDPRVQSAVSLSSGRAVPKKDMVFVLESALRMSNVALLRDAQGYRLIPSADAVAGGSIDWARDPAAGYGISVIPLQFVSAPTLIKLLDNYAAKPGMVRAEPSRNLIIIQGNSADRRAAIDTVLSFDADWMAGQSVGIYPVNSSTPEPVISELEKIIDAGQGGLSQNLVKLEPISRQNAILVVARKPELLKRVATWIKRLDKSGGAGTDVKVYRMHYGDARQVAGLLNDMFIGSSPGASLDSPANQLSPGGGMVSSSSTRSGGLAQTNANGGQPLGAGSTQQTTSSSAFESRFTGQKVAGPSTWNGSHGGDSTTRSVAGAAPLLTNVRISADTVNNDLLIYANQENYDIIKRALQQIDRPQLQVAIDATIAEVTLNDNLQYGVQFFLKSSNVGAPSNTGSILNTAAGAALSQVLPGFNFLAGTQAAPQVIINALHGVTDVKILSNPSLVVVDNQVATLQVGDQIPITTQSAQSTITSGAPIVSNIDYRNTGIILNVAPRINANGNVLLNIEQEISSVANNGNANTLTPTVSQRKVRSTIAVANGQTVLLAGLISETRDRSRSGIPGLDQVPGIGELFSQNTGSRQRTELIIFIRPQIIRNGVDAYRIAAELRDKIIRSRDGGTPAPTGKSPRP